MSKDSTVTLYSSPFLPNSYQINMSVWCLSFVVGTLLGPIVSPRGSGCLTQCLIYYSGHTSSTLKPDSDSSYRINPSPCFLSLTVQSRRALIGSLPRSAAADSDSGFAVETYYIGCGCCIISAFLIVSIMLLPK